MSGVEFAIAGLAVLLGAALQGTIGLGLGMVSGPILALLDPTLVPGPLLMLATLLTLTVVLRERAALDLAGTGRLHLPPRSNADSADARRRPQPPAGRIVRSTPRGRPRGRHSRG
ncbi:hypothetical protein [Actinoalloteichus fjordicus]|uniref:Sulfite exporter TauE/SafE family protein n=1 Tax=Actinoalloteichus fjordicus TaxID=1612552 RepID=A0AAC9PS91_9PSEU|nr:hypothetical protein [Actinoalloteichus fjordicus]APU14752.1 hypothetical protein UA74_13470 [Actinoalloteichus fjordicus]